MAKKLIALILAVMLVLSLMSPVYAVSKPVAATGTVSRTVKVGVINYLTDELGTSNWQIHYWGSTIDADDAQLERDGEATESRSVGEAFWNNAAQTFLMFTATIPAQATGFKVHHGDRWFGDDGTAGQTAYVFNYDGDKALYVSNARSIGATYMSIIGTTAQSGLVRRWTRQRSTSTASRSTPQRFPKT